MKMNSQQYNQYVSGLCPKSPVLKDVCFAFFFGGLICVIGQLLSDGFSSLGLGETDAGTAASCSLIFLSALFTGLSWYDDLAKVAGAGSLVPITGFANSIAAPAIEFKAETVIVGSFTKMFQIAGPVIVSGISASVIYGLIYWIYLMVA